MPKKVVVRQLVAQTAAVATTALRTAKHYAAAMDAVAITVQMSVANQSVIVLPVLKFGSGFRARLSVKTLIQV